MKKRILWGAASAAYQIEGAHNADGKGVSIWDYWSHLPGKTFNGTNGDIACDHYHRFEEDIALMKAQGLQAYRFSIAWTRILPEGTGKVNPKGIAFYDQLIQKLKAAGIEPIITLYHWDLPMVLQETYEGWENRRIVDDFLEYARVCFEAFGDKVQYWIVMNEPNIFCGQGYQLALHPPGKMDDQSYVTCYHHSALAHAKTVIMYKEMALKGFIGSSIAFMPAYTASQDPLDLKALENYDALQNGWHMDPYFSGSYPEIGIAYFTEKGVTIPLGREDLNILKKGAQLTDFIGINYYQTAMIAHNPNDGVGFQGMNTTGQKGSQKESGIPGYYKMVKNPNVSYTDWDWAIDPAGMIYGMKQLKDKYDLPVFISENGLGAFDVLSEKNVIEDTYRINFLDGHVKACLQAVEEGIDIIAYCTWSFTDLLSWLNGYQKRYGFVHIDFDSPELTRRPKASYYWYKQHIEDNCAAK